MDVPAAYFLAALAWAAIVVNIVVVPFFSKTETLFKDLIDSGARDVAMAAIDSQKLLPALASVVTETIRVREERAAEGQSVEITDILTEISFEANLEAAQAAASEKRSIELHYDAVCSRAAKLWKLGIAHALLVVGIPTSLLLPNPAGRLILATLVGTIAAMLLVAIGYCLALFESSRKTLYTALKSNRE